MTSSATVNVNNAVQADLQLAPAEVHYKRVGDKVVVDDSTALNWTAANASTVSIDPLGTVSPTGSRSLQIAPKKTDPGAVDETVTYTLNASNGCGGTATKTATLHIVGSIEQPEIKLAMRSVYFPTDRPRSVKSEAALLPSEKETLKSFADAFKQYLAVQAGCSTDFSPDTPISVDRRPTTSLSPKGVPSWPSGSWWNRGFPKPALRRRPMARSKNLSVDQVKQQVEQDASLSAEDRQKALQKIQTIVLAYNRRVDLT